MPVAFDTLKCADRLAAGGFTNEQAKAAAVALSDTFARSLAAKADLDHAVERLEAKIDRLDAKIDESELGMTVKVGAMMVVLVGVIGVLFKLLH